MSKQKTCNEECRYCQERNECKIFAEKSFSPITCNKCGGNLFGLAIEDESGVVIFCCPECEEVTGEIVVERVRKIRHLEEMVTRGNA